MIALCSALVLPSELVGIAKSNNCRTQYIWWQLSSLTSMCQSGPGGRHDATTMFTASVKRMSADAGCVRGSPQNSGRGVLNGAFAVLDALAKADAGLGLTGLADASGLAKTSAYRLAEQLLVLGAVQRVDRRYYVGARVGRIGQQWQPDPLLRRAAQPTVHALALKCCAVASLRILHEHRLRMICATMPHGHACMPNPADPESTARTATGRVLYATQLDGETALPDCWTAGEWRQLRDCIRDLDAAVVDHQEAFPGICCVSAPVWRQNGTCAAAVTALLADSKVPPGLADLVVHAARRIGAGLA
jgi:DNA-binding IclR family transcriptional regulator